METAILAFEVSLVILMLVSLISMIRLRSKIKAFQSMQGNLQADLRAFSESTEQAQMVFNNLQRAMNDYQMILGKDRKGAEELRQDLLYLIEQGKMIADKLEGSLHDLRPKSEEEAKPAEKKSAPRDDKAREKLMKSIDNLR